MKITDATFAIIDVETTGVDRIRDRVVEVACATFRAGKEIEAFSSLVNPMRSIPSSASAVHHIEVRDVRHAPSLEDLVPRLTALCDGAVVVAHNARFDLAFLPFLSHRPVLCSMCLAMRVLPGADNYKNQGLRVYLGLDGHGPREPRPHRALSDVRITSQILAFCLARYLEQGGHDDLEHLVRDIAVPRHLAALPFGRHRGVPISDVPTDYLRRLYRDSQSAFIDAHYTAECELKRRALGWNSGPPE